MGDCSLDYHYVRVLLGLEIQFHQKKMYWNSELV